MKSRNEELFKKLLFCKLLTCHRENPQADVRKADSTICKTVK